MTRQLAGDREGPSGQLSIFGQGLHPEEAVTAVRLAVEMPDRAELRRELIAKLPQRSAKTRERLAEKLLQRLVTFSGHSVALSPFLRLVATTPDPRAELELIFYRTVQTDRLVSSIAAEILYPHLVAGEPPAGYSEPQFRLANTGSLFEADAAVTRAFISRYARERWGFTREPTLTRALLMLRQVGLIHEVRRRESGRSLAAYARTGLSMALPAFVFCLAETAESVRGRSLRLDQVQQALFAELFLLEPLQVRGLLELGIEAGLLRRAGARCGPTADSLDAVVSQLLRRRRRG